MIDIEDLLNSAGTRVRDASADLTVPVAPRPSRSFTPVAVGSAVAVTALAVAGLTVSHSRHEVSIGAVPQSFLDGTHGTEVVIKQIDDGDHDPLTVTLDAGAAGRVKPTRSPRPTWRRRRPSPFPVPASPAPGRRRPRRWRGRASNSPAGECVPPSVRR